MLKSVTVEEIDQLLDELERLADEPSRRKFLQAVLERLQFVLGAAGAAYVVPTSEAQWSMIAACGRAERCAAPALEADVLQWQSPDLRQLVVPIRRSGGEADWRRGALSVDFGSPPGESEVEELGKLCAAFAEVLSLRQSRELDAFLDQSWPAFQRSLNALTSAQTTRAGAYALTNDLVALTGADRVTLVQARLQGAQVLAISGVPEFKQNAQSVVALQSLSRQALADSKVLMRHSGRRETSAPQPEGVLQNYMVLPIVSSDRQGACDAALVVEWDDYDRFLLGCTIIQLIFPVLAMMWLEHQRWLNVPQLVRWWSRRRWFAGNATVLGHWPSRLAKLAAVALVLGGGWWLLNLPTALRIEARGTLQPVEQRIVYTPLDGVVTRILVKDGQQVRAGELLAELQSPMLEIELEEVAGELRSNQEKLAGLKVAINQLSPEDPSALAMQNRFSSEIREIETWLATLQEKQQALLGEKAKLSVAAPIAGTVIARQVDRYLERRPVRRGDPLLRIVEMDGPWRLELEVADRDAGRVKQKLFAGEEPAHGPVAESAEGAVEFVYAAFPNQRFQATTTWMSEAARNPLGEEVIVDVHARVLPETAAEGHMGATVQAYFDCGQHPFWFVWSRPLVEAIQRKLWF